MLTLLFLGLGISALSTPRPHQSPERVVAPDAGRGIALPPPQRPLAQIWWGIGTYGLGALGAAMSATPMLRFHRWLLTGLHRLTPSCPSTTVTLTALTRLPGSLPSFIVVLLPVVGLHGLATAMPSVPDVVAWTISLFALVGASYGALKALAQSRVRLLLAYGSLSFFSILWWFAAASRTVTPGPRSSWARSVWRRAGSWSPGR